MKSIALISIFAAQVAFATSTTNLTIEGMHCSGCKKIITSKVCDNPEIAKNAESCEVKLTNEEKQIGEIKIVAKANTTIDPELVKKQIAAAGDDYKIAKLTQETKELKRVGNPTETTTTQPVAGVTTTTTTTATETVATDKKGKTKVTKKVNVKKISKPTAATATAPANTAAPAATTETKKETK